LALAALGSDAGSVSGCIVLAFFFSSRRRHTRFSRDWSSDVCSSDLENPAKRWKERNTSGDPERESRSFRLLRRNSLQSGYFGARSEERRVGKEGRSRGSRGQERQKRQRRGGHEQAVGGATSRAG